MMHTYKLTLTFVLASVVTAVPVLAQPPEARPVAPPTPKAESMRIAELVAAAQATAAKQAAEAVQAAKQAEALAASRGTFYADLVELERAAVLGKIDFTGVEFAYQDRKLAEEARAAIARIVSMTPGCGTSTTTSGIARSNVSMMSWS
jgi:hypothetical protein